ncbi:MAG: magnesium and cobalt transport protein CorA [Thermoplasmata archaeon M9B1D]|nr:MAG: magnesium and cobalt transport protein CorA [Thermoplasmata archaeon M9B1D]PNX48487.1 MAG: magnesium and cobalt transport protein CorA [Thermoplasmata archaeon M8B2D]
MPRIIKKGSKSRGLPPGEMVHIGEKKTEKVKISILDYSIGKYTDKEVKNVEECFSLKRSPSVSWINVDGLHETDIIERLGNCFSIHPLVLEDIVNTDQRPKIEDYEKYFFIVLKMLLVDDKEQEIHSEQVSIIFGERFVISFQETIGDVFDQIRERIRKGKGRIRKMGADYLAYSLIDAIVDNYYAILEKIGEKVESLEEDLVSNPSPETLQKIYNLKREMVYLRKSVWPLRDVISNMLRDESKLIKKETHIYLRDLYDHTIQVIDTIETFRDMISGMLDIYMSSISNKMNEVMKVLTIFAAIFIPLTFIVGVYGMNFDRTFPFNMPELNWQFGYIFVWGIMISLVIVMLGYFKHKKWL